MKRVAAIALAACAAVLAGCGLGAGKGSPDVSLLVTRDFGGQTLGQVPAAPSNGSETVMRYLERHFKVSTRYGGGFVQSIDGLAGGRSGDHPFDWFFYVNGIESGEGAASAIVHAGDRVWWDRHNWAATLHIPAIVGSYPEPFVHGTKGKRLPVRVECASSAAAACGDVTHRLDAAGVLAARAVLGTDGGDATLRVLVGPWSTLRDDRAARLLPGGPRSSGVFARFSGDGRELALLDAAGRSSRTLGAGAGLVAATRYRDQLPTWLVTGTDDAGVAAAARSLSADALGNHFAVAVDGGAHAVGLPLMDAR